MSYLGKRKSYGFTPMSLASRFASAAGNVPYLRPWRKGGRYYGRSRKVWPVGARRRSNNVARALVNQGVETKYFDSSLTGQAITANSTFTGCELNPGTKLCLNCPTQGTGASNRDGRKITMTSIEITGSITQAAQADQTAADTVPTVYLALVLDTQTNGGSATGLDSELVYTNPSGVAATSTAPLRNMLYSKRFKVLKVWCEDLRPLQAVYDGTNIEQAGQGTKFKIFKSFGRNGLTTEFLGNAGTVADITDNGLFVVGVCGPNTTTTPTINYNARLRFRG
nr:capsid protein [Mute swan feces associated circular virus 16]